MVIVCRCVSEHEPQQSLQTVMDNTNTQFVTRSSSDLAIPEPFQISVLLTDYDLDSLNTRYNAWMSFSDQFKNMVATDLSNSIVPITLATQGTVQATSLHIVPETFQETITVTTTLSICSNDSSGPTSSTASDPPTPALSSNESAIIASTVSSLPSASGFSEPASSPSITQSATTSTDPPPPPASPLPPSSSFSSLFQSPTTSIYSPVSPLLPSSAYNPPNHGTLTPQSFTMTHLPDSYGNPPSISSSSINSTSSSTATPPETTLATVTQPYTSTITSTPFGSTSLVSTEPDHTAISSSIPPSPPPTSRTSLEQSSIFQSASSPFIQSEQTTISQSSLPSTSPSTPITASTSSILAPPPPPPSLSTSDTSCDVILPGNVCADISSIEVRTTATATAPTPTSTETIYADMSSIEVDVTVTATAPTPTSTETIYAASPPTSQISSIPAHQLSISSSYSGSYSDIYSLFASLSSNGQLTSITDIYAVTRMDPSSNSLLQPTSINGTPFSLPKSPLGTTIPPSPPPLPLPLPPQPPSNISLTPSISIYNIRRQDHNPPSHNTGNDHIRDSENPHPPPPQLPTNNPTARYQSFPLHLLATLLLALSLLLLLTRYQLTRRRLAQQREWLRRRLERQRRGGLGRIR